MPLFNGSFSVKDCSCLSLESASRCPLGGMQQSPKDIYDLAFDNRALKYTMAPLEVTQLMPGILAYLEAGTILIVRFAKSTQWMAPFCGC